MVQLPMASVALLKLTLPEPATAVTEPPQVLVTPGVAATTRFAGKVSVKLESTAMTFGLVTLKVNAEEAFTATVVGLKLFVMWSGSNMMMPTLAVPPLDAPSPPAAVYVNVVDVGVPVIANVPL